MSTPATAVNTTTDADLSTANLPEEGEEPKKMAARSTSTATTEDTVDCSGLYADVGFLFEGQQATEPTRVETFEWNNLQPDGRSITVQCRCVVQQQQQNVGGETASGRRVDKRQQLALHH